MHAICDWVADDGGWNQLIWLSACASQSVRASTVPNRGFIDTFRH
jgi:hypothetical protein